MCQHKQTRSLRYGFHRYRQATIRWLWIISFNFKEDHNEEEYGVGDQPKIANIVKDGQHV